MKRPGIDINNMNDNTKKNDHLYSDILGGSAPVRTPVQKKPDDFD
jgi:hypothetical protein